MNAGQRVQGMKIKGASNALTGHVLGASMVSCRRILVLNEQRWEACNGS